MAEAAEVLKHLQQHSPGAYTTYRQLKYAGQRKDAAAIREHLKILIGQQPPEGMLDNIIEQLEKLGQSKPIDDEVSAAVTRDDSVAIVADVWIKRRYLHSRLEDIDALIRDTPSAVVRENVACAYLIWMGDRAQASRFRRFVKKTREALRTSPRLWAAVGNGYISIKDYRAAREWLADWSTRDGLEPYMLLNVVLALRACKCDDEARVAVDRGLGLPEDNATVELKLFKAFDDALSGKFDSTTNIIGTIRAETLRDFYKAIYSLTQALLETQFFPSHEAFTSAKLHVSKAFKDPRWQHTSVLLRRMYLQTVAHLARKQGGAEAKIWATICKMVNTIEWVGWKLNFRVS
jgi:hypothetical protein